MVIHEGKVAHLAVYGRKVPRLCNSLGQKIVSPICNASNYLNEENKKFSNYLCLSLYLIFFSSFFALYLYLNVKQLKPVLLESI
jgi:hypothetical protein